LKRRSEKEEEDPSSLSLQAHSSPFAVIRYKVAVLRWEVWTSTACNDRGPATVNPHRVNQS